MTSMSRARAFMLPTLCLGLVAGGDVHAEFEAGDAEAVVQPVDGPALETEGDPRGESQPGQTEPDAPSDVGEDQDIEVIRVVDRPAGSSTRVASAFTTEIDLERFAGEQKRLEDLLAQVVGVQIRRFGGPGGRAEVSIRGSSPAQVVVLLDGVVLNGGRGNGVNLASVPISQLEAVEVSRGGGALGAGSGAMGGVVELRTRKPDYPSTVMSAKGGSFGMMGLAAARTQPGDRVDTGFGYSGFKSDGDFEFARIVTEYPGDVTLPPSTPSAERINNEHEQHDGHVNFGFDFDERGYLLAQQSIGYFSRGEPGLDRESPSEIAGQQRFAEQKVLRSISQLRWEDITFTTGDVTADASLSHRFESSKFRDRDPALGANPIRDDFDDMSTTLSVRPGWHAPGPLGAHRLAGELRFERDGFKASDTSSEERYGASVSLRDNVNLDMRGTTLIVVPGVRFDWTDEAGSHMLPSLGAVIEPISWLRIKANVDRSFRNPSFYDLHLPDRGFISGNRELDPERALNYDVGVELAFDSPSVVHNVRVAASVFRSEIKDSIVWLRVSPFKVRPENTDDATAEGLEVSLSFDVGSY